MKLSIDNESLCEYVAIQLNRFFPDEQMINSKKVLSYLDDTMMRLKLCFENIHKPYYNFGEGLCFNHLHGDHYAMFLYLLSNTVWEVDRNENLASKLFLLNKALHGLDAFYSIGLPEIFIFVHPVGTVLGKAKYSNFFAVYQGVTVGATEDNKYPAFSEGVLMYSKSSIIGNCKIGSNVVFSANSLLINTDVEDSRLILGAYPNNKIIKNNKDVIDRIFR